ncbi:MAG: hypothetical protein KatS3mg131_0493 [Candidatus Tectimicrobiota bacterium]|nr:MAG: hypothetical protein KatS3mg131_0493 [Candidatus Tectomicrobia bacterium]
MQLGFIGVGNIGTPICHHLIKAGHRVIAYDVNPAHLARIVNLGAQAADSPQAVAQACDLVFTSLPGPARSGAGGAGRPRPYRRCPPRLALRRLEHQRPFRRPPHL